MKIAIVGAGMTGAYLYRLLQGRNHTISIFDKRAENTVRVNPLCLGNFQGFP